jgi:carbonic anhydrase
LIDGKRFPMEVHFVHQHPSDGFGVLAGPHVGVRLAPSAHRFRHAVPWTSGADYAEALVERLDQAGR